MQINYEPSTVEGSLKTLHKITIETETFESTRAKEVLKWAKPRIFSKYVWKFLKNAVRLGESLSVHGGGLFE